MTRLLLSSYACRPGRGSEPGAGWAWAIAAASTVEQVRLLTRRVNVAAIQQGLDELHITNVEVEGLELGPLWRFAKRTLPFGTQLYYLMWQRALSRRVATFRVGDFTVAHHLTFAADWLPVGVSSAPCPLVLGPVGGATRTSMRELHLYPKSAWAEEIIRNVITGAGRLVWGRPAMKRAAVVLAQNRDELAAFPAAPIIVEPNVIAEPPEAPLARPGRRGTQREAVVVGRLVPMKGVQHALQALSQPEAAGWCLTIIGSGRLEPRLRSMATLLGINNRVTFAGQLSHSETVTRIRKADALVSLSLHEAAGFAVAEAVAAGTPVVYAAKGGPLELTGTRDHPVQVSASIATQVGAALAKIDGRLAPTDRWSASRLPALQGMIYAMAEAGAIRREESGDTFIDPTDATAAHLSSNRDSMPDRPYASPPRLGAFHPPVPK